MHPSDIEEAVNPPLTNITLFIPANLSSYYISYNLHMPLTRITHDGVRM